jgi:hypothetical protein
MFIELHLYEKSLVENKPICVNTNRVEKITPHYSEKEEESYVSDFWNPISSQKITRMVWREDGTYIIFSMDLNDSILVKESYDEIKDMLEVK